MPKLVNRGPAGLLKKTHIDTPMKETPTRPKSMNKIAPALKNLVVDISSLKHDPLNAREHNERNLDSIKDSLAFYGQVKPVVVRKETRVVMAGNGTLQSAREMGWTKIAASIVSMTDVEAAGYGLADNRTAELARWNFEVVAKLDKLLVEAGHSNIGWSLEELTVLRMDQTPHKQDEDKIPAPPAVPISTLGDVWTLENHRLMCGDSCDSDAVVTLMGDVRACLMATDPPYGVDFAGQKYNPRAKAWAGIEGDKVQGMDLQKFVTGFIKTWLPSIDERAGFYFWSAAMKEGFAALNGILDAGLHVQAQIIWNKNCLVLGQADYHWKHENCWYAFFKGKKHIWHGERDKTTVWEVKKVSNADYLHPMQKPTELYEIPINHHTSPGDIVAEPFSGSGTQLIAAHKLSRICYAMELDPVYVDVALQRWADFTGMDPVRQDGKKFSELKKKRPAKK